MGFCGLVWLLSSFVGFKTCTYLWCHMNSSRMPVASIDARNLDSFSGQVGGQRLFFPSLSTVWSRKIHATTSSHYTPLKCPHEVNWAVRASYILWRVLGCYMTWNAIVRIETTVLRCLWIIVYRFLTIKRFALKQYASFFKICLHSTTWLPLLLGTALFLLSSFIILDRFNLIKEVNLRFVNAHYPISWNQPNI